MRRCTTSQPWGSSHDDLLCFGHVQKPGCDFRDCRVSYDHRATSYNVTRRRTMSHDVVQRHTTSYNVTRRRTMSHNVMRCRGYSYNIFTCSHLKILNIKSLHDLPTMLCDGRATSYDIVQSRTIIAQLYHVILQ